MPIHWVGRETLPTPYTPPTPRQVRPVHAPAPSAHVDEHAEEEPETSADTSAARSAAQRYREVAGEDPSHRARVRSAAQLMTSPVIALGPEAPLADAARLLNEHGFHHLPVVDDAQRIVGILSDRDLLRGGQAAAARHGRGRVGDLMSTELLTATPDTSLREVARVMTEERIGALPLVDEEQHLLGILTTTDILRGLLRGAPLELWI